MNKSYRDYCCMFKPERRWSLFKKYYYRIRSIIRGNELMKKLKGERNVYEESRLHQLSISDYRKI